MNLLDLAVKITCDDQASGQVEGIGSRITGTFSKVAGVASAVMGSAAVAGAVAIGKSALDAYASYEQLVGGVDTLFKDASGQLQAYAAQAYQTAGMSANQYMETTTSFSASLIQGLGGDTQRAVEVANMAITDMSDNANKMGTDIDVIREAYQGFAKDNYDMLDNLKLGYGGTQAEMARLINDTGVMGDSFKATAKNVNEVPFDKMIEAIHQVQTEMGITGTTALEASTTIEGSVNTMKAAWENWLTGLGNEDADISGLTDQLLNSIGTVAQNVGPRIGIIIGTIVTEIGNRGPEIAAALRDMLFGAFSQGLDIVNTFVQENFGFSLPEVDTSQITSAVEGVTTTVQDVVSFLQETFGPGIQQAMELVGPIVEQVSEFFSHMGTQIQTVLGPALDYLGPAFTNFMSALQVWIEPLGNVAQIFGNILVAAISAFTYALGTVMNVFAAVTAAIQDFDNFLNGQPSVIGTVIQGIITWFQQLPGNIASFLGFVISSVASWVGQMASNAVSAGSQFVSNVVSFISSLPGQIAGFLGGVIANVASWVGQMASNAADAASRFASNLISGLQSIPGRVVSIGRQIIQGMVDGVVGAAGMLIDAVGGAVSDAIGWAKGLLGIASPSKVFREIGQFTMQGAALGVEDDAPMLARSTEDAMRGMVRSATPTRAASHPASAGAGYGDLVEAVESLHEDLGRIISRYTPTMDKRYFKNAVRSVVA